MQKDGCNLQGEYGKPDNESPYSIYEKYHPWLQHFLAMQSVKAVWDEIKKEYVKKDILMCKSLDVQIKCLYNTFNKLQEKKL